MANDKPRQKTRSSRKSQGTRRSSKGVTLTPIQKVLLGKGLLSTEAHRSTFRPKKMKRERFDD